MRITVLSNTSRVAWSLDHRRLGGNQGGRVVGWEHPRIPHALRVGLDPFQVGVIARRRDNRQHEAAPFPRRALIHHPHPVRRLTKSL
jgi:hypothetical protein